MDASLLRDLAEEEAVLDQLVASLDGREWASATPATDWTVADTIAHLAVSERAAADSLCDDRDPVSGLAGSHAPTEVPEVPDHERPATGFASSTAVLAEWRTQRARVLDAFADRADDDRVPWGGRRMAVRSLATARLMETWAHGLDCFAGLGVTPIDTDRLAPIAWLGWKTLPYAFAVAGESPPAPPADLRLELVSPGGARWEYGPPLDAAAAVVRGSAGDWCRVATHRFRRTTLPDLVADGPLAVAALRVARAFL
jgi:uncharacterized protein (TIGR03084 family)